jgi:hypothetical protein
MSRSAPAARQDASSSPPQRQARAPEPPCPGAEPSPPPARPAGLLVPTTPAGVLRLQRLVGNRAVGRILAQPVPLRAARAVRPAPDARSLQAKLKLDLGNKPPKWAEAIAFLVDDYNKALASIGFLSPEKDRRAALGRLALVERWLYKWFGKQNAPDVTEVEHGLTMRDLLNQARDERTALVKSRSYWDKLPPIANLDSLSKEELTQVSEIWAKLVGGKEIEITGPSGFKEQVLADFTRILETETGRQMVGALVQGGKVVVISASKPGGKFVASPDDPEREEVLAIEEPKGEAVKEYAVLDFSGEMSVQERKEALHDVRTSNPKAKGFAVKTKEGTKYFAFAKGTTSTLTIPIDAVDASLGPSGRGVGLNDEEIIAPVFINLAHELGHVLRSLQGISTGYYGGAKLVAHAFPDVKVEDRAEEFFNIGAVENRIRAEAGISRRKGHSNWVGDMALALQIAVDAVRSRAEKVGEGSSLEKEVAEEAKRIVEKCYELGEPLLAFTKLGGSPAKLWNALKELALAADALELKAKPISKVSSSELNTPSIQSSNLSSSSLEISNVQSSNLVSSNLVESSNLVNTNVDSSNLVSSPNLTTPQVTSTNNTLPLNTTSDTQVTVSNVSNESNDKSNINLKRRVQRASARAPAPRRPVLSAPPSAIQAFGIDDRRWDQVKSVRHLGATAYAADADDGSVVVKASGKGTVEYRVGEEGPVQEALAAAVGGLEALGVRTAKTDIVLTAGGEGKAVVKKVASLDEPGPTLASALGQAEAFLVMELAPGVPAAKAGALAAKASPQVRGGWYEGLGRLYVFDVLIHNTDRFYAGNWGNVVLGAGGEVTGIDQMIGFAASDVGKDGPAAEYVTKALKTMLDPGRRRTRSAETFISLAKHMEPSFAADEALFALRFEAGMLDAAAAAGTIKPKDLLSRQAQLPEFAAESAKSLGLGGAADMLKVFAEAADTAKEQRVLVQKEAQERSGAADAIDRVLGTLEVERGKTLKHFGQQATALAGDYDRVSKWYTGKANYWAGRKKDLAALGSHRQDEYMETRGKASGAAKGEEHAAWLKKQLKEWTNGLLTLWGMFASLTDGIKDTSEIGPRITDLRKAIAAEQARPRVTDRL